MNQILFLLQLTIRAPRQAGYALKSMGLDVRFGMAGLAAAVILGVVTLFALNGFEPVEIMPGTGGMSPVTIAVYMMVTNLLLMGAVLVTGRVFGGTGEFAQGLILFAWLQFIQLAFQAVLTILALIVGPMIGGFLALALMMYLFWILFNFIAALHDFNAIWKAVVTFFLGLFALSFALAIGMAIIGVQPPTGVI